MEKEIRRYLVSSILLEATMQKKKGCLTGKRLMGGGLRSPALSLVVVLLLLALQGCGGGAPERTKPSTQVPSSPTPSIQVPSSPTPSISVFDTGRTVFGFFPSSPELTSESFVATLEAIGQHGDVILVQMQIPWADFIDQPDSDSPAIVEMRNTLTLARQNGLEPIFVTDPLQAFDRSKIATFPPELVGGNFGTPGVRQAFKNYALCLVREFHPRYLGLASEINTYADAQPEDFSNYLSLYREVYAAIKAEAPETQVFVTFQWEDLNGVGPFADDAPGRVKWETVEAFEPELDVWAISTYPYFAFDDAAQIPADYYTPLLSRTSKPLAIAEGGYLSENAGVFQGSLQGQVGYLNALDTQIGDRLAFWIYLVIDDVDTAAYARFLTEHGSPADEDLVGLFGTLGFRTKDGEPKPALATWDELRSDE